jgi:hypothetical protein
MKLILNTFLILLFISTSCEGQEKNKNLNLTYFAQTRGYSYSLQLEDSHLEINDNNNIKKLQLSKTNINELTKILSEIDFTKIENNISIDDLAVDKAIKGNFDLVFKKKKYSFEFDHHNLPEKIKQLLSFLGEAK